MVLLAAFRCPKHGIFDVAAAVLESARHMSASEDDWDTVLKKARDKAVSRARPRILKYDFHDLPPQSNETQGLSARE